MSLLAEVYRAALPADRPTTLSDEVLESALSGLHAVGRAAHPDVALTAEAFAGHLARCAAALDGDDHHQHVGDLFLAAAVLNGDAPAVDKLRQSCWPLALKYLRPFREASIDDVAQELWNALLFGEPGKYPKLQSYSGKGPLGAFVGITAQRLALMRLRRDGADARLAGRAAAEINALASDPELAFIKDQHRDSFQEVLKVALQSLDDRARMVLRMYLIDGLSVDRIAKVYGVSQSSVSRWLAKARDAVLDETRRLLSEKLRLSESEFESLWNVLNSELDLSMSRVLGEVA
jgi:RNA polymerase sigma-70 factor (ECF subfamily)